MSMIDRQRSAATKALEPMGYTFDAVAWNTSCPPAGTLEMIAEADALHSLLVLRADKLVGCTEGSEEEEELQLIAETVMAYEAKRWPDGKVPGGKG